jgi:hypothetical protein
MKPNILGIDRFVNKLEELYRLEDVWELEDV